MRLLPGLGFGFSQPGFQFLSTVAPAANPLYDFTTGTYTNGAAAPSVSRASSGYVEDLAGLLTLVSANTLRRTNKGALIEPAATNLWPNSTTPPGGTNATATTPSGTAPDGGTASSRLDYTANTTSQFQVGVAATTGQPYTFSVYQKGVVGGEVNNIYNGGGFTVVGAIKTTSTTGWVRSSVTSNATENPFIYRLGTNSVDSRTSAPTTARSIYTAFFQVEQGSVPTSYIPTSGAAATRAADAVSITIPSGYTQAVYTFDDNSTQTVTGLTTGSYTLPTTFAPKYVKTLELRP